MDYNTNEIPSEVIDEIKNRYLINHEYALKIRQRALVKMKEYTTNLLQTMM